MSTNELHRSRWFMPLFCLLLGAVMLVAFAIGGDVIQGVFSFGVMAALAAVFAFAPAQRDGPGHRRSRP